MAKIKPIDELPELQTLGNDAMLVASQDGDTYKVLSGKLGVVQAQQYAQDAAASAAQASTVLSGSVRYDTAQTLTDAKKAQARENIDALEPDGYYEGLTSGNAEQLLSSIAVTDKAPYLFRHAGGNNDIGNRETVKAVTGGSVAWNQLASASLFLGTGGSVAANGNALVYTLSTVENNTTGNRIQQSNMAFVGTHKYRIAFDIKPPHDNTGNMYIYIGSSAYQRSIGRPAANAWTHYDLTVVPSGNATYFRIAFCCYENAGYAVGDTIEVRNIIITDLTLMLTPSVADYVYSLEQSNAGSGIAWLKSYGYFTKDYYPYTEPVMKHVTGLVSHDMVGFNQWDEDWELGTYSATTGEKITSSNTIRCKNKIAVLPSTNYYLNVPYNIASLGTYVLFYDADENFVSSARKFSRSLDTPQNARYMTFTCPASYGTTYNHDICINLSHSGYRNGEYEPYVKHSYPLDSTVTLRGVPKLDASNNLYYDGDIYPSSGEGTSRYGIVDLGTLNWDAHPSLQNVYQCNGSSLGYKPIAGGVFGNGVCSKYTIVPSSVGGVDAVDKSLAFGTGGSTNLYIHDSAYSSVDEFRTAMQGVYLVYEKKTPTTFSAAPYSEIQICDDFGTEEYVVTPDADGFSMPVGHETEYMQNLRDKLQRLPNLPDADGTYLVQYSNRQCSFVQYIAPTGLPTAPSGDGTYALKATVADGTVTYSWVSE